MQGTAENAVDCRIIVSRLGAPRTDKYGLTVERMSGNKTLGWDNVRHIQNDDALFKILSGLGYSASEISEATEQLSSPRSNWIDHRKIADSALKANRF